jgi:hypothetical protein
VLLALAAPIDTSFPTLRQFDHLIAAVKRSDDEYEFADLVAQRAAFGDLPKYEQGKFGLLIHDDGTYDQVQLPEPPVPANRIQVSFIGDLDAAGAFKGRWTSSLTGNARYRAALLMESNILPDSNARASCTRSFADSLRAKHVPDSLPSLDAPEMRSEERIAIHACDSRIVSDAGGVKLLELPLVDLSNHRLVAMLEGSGPRRMPIDAGKASGEFEFVEELKLTLPPGWRARLPVNVTATSVFGAYEAVYAQTGRELDVRRRYTGARGVYPASSYGELIAWLSAKAADDVKVIVIDH